MPKGQCYGGVVKLPTSPHADMHGMVRAIIRTEFFTGAAHAMERLGCRVLATDLGRTWGVSTSAIELEVTARDYGEVYTCALATAYLQAEYYRHHPFPRRERDAERGAPE